MYVRRKVFVSYHHDQDRPYYQALVDRFADRYELVHDNSVDRTIDSDNPEYVMRRIRENYLTGASVTIVLCGPYTWGRKYVDWEILASLNQQMGLVGINLPTNPVRPDGTNQVPDRYFDNWRTGYAQWEHWDRILSQPALLPTVLEASLSASRRLIDNSRPKRLINAPTR